jgi:two-component system response regulator
MDTSPALRPKSILLVEDSATDSRLVRLALSGSPRPRNLEVSVDGEAAMGYLHACLPGAYPELIILDLNLPKKDGWQVLAECKADLALRCIPIVVFTTSGSQRDVDRCYALGANSFVTKPFDLDAFQRAVAMIEEFWLGLSAPWAKA